MVTLLDDSVQLVLFLIVETFHSAVMKVLGNKEDEKYSDIMHLFTGMALYVRDNPPISYVY